jgi:deoxyxylulose-5-phosphate synthase
MNCKDTNNVTYIETLGRLFLFHRMNYKENINATLINPRFLSGVDHELLQQLKNDHKLVITLEDGVLDGGFGEKIARFYGAIQL